MHAVRDVSAEVDPAVRRSRRGWRAVAIVLACGWFADRHALPALAACGLTRALASSGFPDARFEIEGVGLERMQVHDLRLADGVDLGDIELDVGLSALWGSRPTRATVRGARVALEAASKLRLGDPAARPPLERVRVEGAELTSKGDRATITGEISLAGPLAADLRATGVRIGGLAIEELGVQVREHGKEYGAAWELRGAGWTARGDGVLAWRDGALAVARSHTELQAPSLRTGPVSLDGASATLEIAGPLAALEVHGDAHAERARLASAAAILTLRDVHVPIAVRADPAGGALAVRSRSVVAHAGEAMLVAAGHQLRAADLEIELGDGEERTLVSLGPDTAWPAQLRWRAANARDGEVRLEQLAGSSELGTNTHAITWRSIAARSLEAGGGEIHLRIASEQVRIERARLAVADGELSIGPTAIPLATDEDASGTPADLVITARGLRLGRLLPGHSVEATAVLDGEVALQLAGSGATLVRGELHARGPGTIRVADPALRERVAGMAGLERRVVGALADFEHTTLAAVLGPRGSDPELRVTARGRGASVPQELDLAINFHGVWTTLDRLARSYR